MYFQNISYVILSYQWNKSLQVSWPYTFEEATISQAKRGIFQLHRTLNAIRSFIHSFIYFSYVCEAPPGTVVASGDIKVEKKRCCPMSPWMCPIASDLRSSAWSGLASTWMGEKVLPLRSRCGLGEKPGVHDCQTVLSALWRSPRKAALAQSWGPLPTGAAVRASPLASVMLLPSGSPVAWVRQRES